MKFFLPFFGILFFTLTAFSQSEVNQITLSKMDFSSESLSQKFKKYDVYELPSISNSYESSLLFHIQFGEEKHFSLLINRSYLLDKDTKIIVSTPTGDKLEDIVEPFTFFGKEVGTSNSCALTLNSDFFCGFVERQDDGIYWEPLFRLVPDAPRNMILIYHSEDIIPNSNVWCMVDESKKARQKAENNIEKNPENTQLGCYEIEFAQAADFSMWQKYGGATGVATHMASVMNLSQANYDDELNWNLQLKINGVWLSSCSSCDPWTNSTNMNDLLFSFRDWAVAPNSPFASIPHDLGELWTNRDMDFNFVGWAWGGDDIGVACWNNFKYHWIQDFTTNIQDLRETVSHETGHNLSASHDGSGSYIMSPGGNGSNTWSQQSLNSINTYVQTKIDDGCFTSSTSVGFSSSTIDLTTTFTNTSTNATSYFWNFGDGQTSTQTSPSHTYTSPGSYNVCLTVTGTCGDETVCNYVNIAYDYCWHWQNPLPQGNSINNINFVDTNVGWSVGNAGIILKTTDGGNHWYNQPTGVSSNLVKIQMLSNLIGWVVGDNGVILKTINGGEDWQIVPSGTTYYNFNDVAFVNENVGWVVGDWGRILKTINGGTSWITTVFTYQGSSYEFSGIYMLNEQNGWIVSKGNLFLSTNDSGTNWIVHTEGSNSGFSDIQFTDDLHGWISTSQPKILKTSDGGLTWQVKNTSINIRQLFFFDNNFGYGVRTAFGSNDGAVVTFDGGDSWQTVSLSTQGLTSVFFITNQYGWMSNSQGQVLKTNDGGQNWFSQTISFGGYSAESVCFKDSNKGWLCGIGTFGKTDNGGRTWQDMPIPQIGPVFLKDIYFIDTLIGWAVGNNGGIIKTLDGGNFWQVQRYGGFNDLFAIQFINTQIGWAVGKSEILKTTDGGTTWQTQEVPSIASYLLDIQMLSETNGFICGSSTFLGHPGIILKTTDGGDSWSADTLSIPLRDLFFINSDIGWVVGGGNGYGERIFYTQDAGNTWTQKHTNSSGGLYSVHFTNSAVGYAVGDYGQILSTKNGGLTWQKQSFMTDKSLYDVFFIDYNTGWAVGSGIIIKFGNVLSPVTQDLSFCKNTSAAQLSAIGANLLWYTTPTGGTGSTVAPTPNTNITGTTTYYVTQSPIGFGSCTESERAAITVTVTSPNVSVSSTNACSGNGTATASASGSTAPYTYLWNNSQTTSTINNLTPGTYVVTVTDANGCSKTATTTVSSGAAPQATISNTQTSCPGQNSGSATVSVSGGASPYTYHWSNNQNTATATGLSPGNYFVTVTGTNGCYTTATATINPSSTPVVTVSNMVSPCSGYSNGSATVSVSGGVSPYTYSWNNGQSGATANNLSSENYTVTVIGNNGCTATVTVNVGTSIAPIATISNTESSCVGLSNGSVTVSASGGVSPYTFLWNNSQVTATATNIGSGSYTVTVTGSNGCTATVNAIVGTAVAPNATISNTLLPCTGLSNGSATVSASGGVLPYTYLWNNNQTSAIATNLSTGTYIVTVTGNNGCTATAITTISTSPAPTATISNTIAPCSGLSNGSVTVTASGGISPYSYLWSNNQTTPIITDIGAGLYTVTVTESNGCTSSTSVTISTLPSMLISSGPTNPSCSGQNNGNTSVAVAGGEAPYTYTWSNGQTIPILTDLPAGTYMLTVTDINGCTAITSVNIIAAISPTASISSTIPACEGQNNGSISVIASGGNTPYFYNWNDGQMSAIAANLSSGMYTVTVTGSNGCSATTGTSVMLASSPIISISNDNPTCLLQNEGSLTAEAIGGIAPYTYSWSNGQNTATISNLYVGTYMVTVTGSNGCSMSSAGSVELAQPPSATISDINPACEGDNNGSITLSVIGGTAPYTYEWNNGNTTPIISNLSPGSYIVTIIDALGCTTALFANVGSVQAPIVSISSTIPACSGQSNGSAVLSVTSGTEPYQYSWSDGQTTNTVNNLASGTYGVTIDDENGCQAITTVDITNTLSPVLTIESTPSCFGQSTGTAFVAVTQGIPPYDYIWSNNQASPDIQNVNPDMYSVTVTGSNSCTSVASVTISEIPAFSVELVTSLEANGNNCTSTANITNGTSPFTFLWSNGQTNPTATNLPEGDFSVTITDATGCTSVQTSSCLSVGTDNFGDIEEFWIRPNPATDNVTIHIRSKHQEDLSFRVYNSIGQLLTSYEYYSNEINEVVNVNDFPTGCYLFQVLSKVGSKSEVIMIVR
jgi:photosystem II stability/assembly factor-like uncharacterized protein